MSGERQADEQADGQADGQRDGQADGQRDQADEQAGGQEGWQAGGETGQAGEHAGERDQAGGQADGNMARQRDQADEQAGGQRGGRTAGRIALVVVLCLLVLSGIAGGVALWAGDRASLVGAAELPLTVVSESSGELAPTAKGAATRGLLRSRSVTELQAFAVYDDDFARDHFYTWTSAEQVAALRGGEDFLSADATTGGRPTPFHQALAKLAKDSGQASEVARLLVDDPGLRRRRYAWVSAFATVLGLGPRRYGDELIEVELRGESWLGKFDPVSSQPLEFVNLEGEPVTLAQVLAEPGRIAAVYHLRSREIPAYREYVLCNQAMIRRWSIRTPKLALHLERERRLLADLVADAFVRLPDAAIVERATPHWRRAGGAASAPGIWRASLAFDTPRYRPSIANLRRIDTALAEARVGGEALRWPRQGP